MNTFIERDMLHVNSKQHDFKYQGNSVYVSTRETATCCCQLSSLKGPFVP